MWHMEVQQLYYRIHTLFYAIRLRFLEQPDHDHTLNILLYLYFARLWIFVTLLSEENNINCNLYAKLTLKLGKEFSL